MSGFDVQGLEGGMPEWIRPPRLDELRPEVQEPTDIGGAVRPDAGFGGVLADQIDRVSRLQADVRDQVRDLAAGEPVELHDIMMSMGKSEVAFNLMLEVRNKLVDAWERLSRSVV